MKILNLYAGVGGNRRLWGGNHDVVAVEIDQKICAEYSRLYPDDQIINVDAHQYLLDHFAEYDFIWSSPPCPTHGKMAKSRWHFHKNPEYPDMRLYQEIILLQHIFKGKFVVENVMPYYRPLIRETVKLGRHLFWSNFDIPERDFRMKYPNGGHNQGLITLTVSELEDLHDLRLTPGKLNRMAALRNYVDPRVGRYILECAKGANHAS